MTKTLVITLVDGTVISRDLANAIQVGMKDPKVSIRDFSKANAPFFAIVMQEMASYGFIHYEVSTESHAKFICPSQIKSIEVVFGDNGKMGLTKS